MAAAGGGCSSGPGQASSLLGSAATWPLKRYGRFLPPKEGEDQGQNTSSWKVFESNEESGHLILTIVVSGHFFISQGSTVLDDPNPQVSFQPLKKSLWNSSQYQQHDIKEGFSLIDSHKWLNIVRRADCLLLRAQAKNECRMFRVQFGGDSKEQMLEHCCGCVQKLAEYVPVQVADEQGLHQLANSENQAKDAEQDVLVLHRPDEPPSDSCASPGERRSVTQLAQSVLNKKPELPLAYRHAAWRAQELGPFIRLCLMDQNFPAFVEDVEKELKKLTEG